MGKIGKYISYRQICGVAIDITVKKHKHYRELDVKSVGMHIAWYIACVSQPEIFQGEAM